MLMSPYKGETAVYRAAIARVIKWMCACMRNWLGRGLVYVCLLLKSLPLPNFLGKKRQEETLMCRRTGYGFLLLS